MAWNDVLVERLRYWINDLDPTDYNWTDLQLEKFLAIGTINVVTDLIGFDAVIGGPYTINTKLSGSGMIVPDPVDTSKIPGFGNLIVMNAGYIMASAELKKLGASAGYRITDDKSTFDGTKAIEVAVDVRDNYSKAYKDALMEFRKGNVNAGFAILSPYSSANFSRGMWFGYGYNGFYPNRGYRGSY